MGWSCSEIACRSMERINALGEFAHIASVGNVFADWSDRETDKGCIFGSLYDTGGNKIVTFQIDGDTGRLSNFLACRNNGLTWQQNTAVKAWLELIIHP